MTWNDLVCLVDQKMREVGCHADELEIWSINCGYYPEETNLDLSIGETPSTYLLRIDYHP